MMSCCSNSSERKQNTFTALMNQDISDNCTATHQIPCCPASCIEVDSGCSGASCCDSIPEVSFCSREYRQCTDANGCAAQYPADCRNRFWPNFSHPRWLPCRCLYCSRHNKH